MTCASCANHIERKLNKLDGVTATVNYATEKAKVSYDEGIEQEALVEAVEQAGYTARLPEPKTTAGASEAGADSGVEDDPVRPLRHRMIISGARRCWM
jgi:Cu+-exporting ATPase